MRAGQMNSRCRFERRVEAADAYGNVTDGSWREIMTVWGSLFYESGREAMAAGRPESSVRATLWIHSSQAARDLTPADRVTIADAEFAVIALVEAPESGRIRVDLDRGVAG